MKTSSARNVADVFRRIIAPLLGPGKEAEAPPSDFNSSALGSALKLVAEIGEIMDERSRLSALRDEEDDRAAALDEKIRQTEKKRLDALTDQRIGPPPVGGGAPAELLAQVMALRQEFADVSGVCAGLDDRIRALDFRLEPLKRGYRQALGAFLEAIFAEQARRYHAAVPEAREALLQIAALRRVMGRYLAGNSNGWDGSVLMPGIKPGEGRYIPPVLDASSPEFAQEANERMEAIFERMREAGFIWRFD